LALEGIVKRNQQWMEREARRWLRDANWAPDVVQEVFLRLLVAHANIACVKDFHAFISTLIRQMCMDFNRMERRKGTGAQSLDEWRSREPLAGGVAEERPLGAPPPWEVGDVPGREPVPESHLEELERTTVLHNAILLLPGRLRRLVYLVYFEGVPLSQVAAESNTTLYKAKSRLERGTRLLRGLLVSIM